MLRIFKDELFNDRKFVITLELVPGRESTGKSVDTVIGIARDSYSDGRVSAVSITDNPGGNPSLSPDVIGHEIFKVGMDVIVHFTCRDLNRAGIESRALQLALMGMKNILALTGDYTGSGFGGQGAPVFDFDSVTLLMMLNQLGYRLDKAGDPDGFFAGCAVSPFKQTEAEGFAQYAKLCRKIAAGAQFVITQLGYDALKFAELLCFLKQSKSTVPVIGSTYLLNPKAAKLMNQGIIPGAVVTDKLLKEIETEWSDSTQGRKSAIERTAKLGAILKGLGYRGMHIGGIHHSFDTVGRILDRILEIEPHWKAFLPDFEYPIDGGFYAFPKECPDNVSTAAFGSGTPSLGFSEKVHMWLMKSLHAHFFSFESDRAPFYSRICYRLNARPFAKNIVSRVENFTKNILLDCQQCGDCGIQHLAFLCPESQCPKHMRNGACGGSRGDCCEVYPDRQCVWVRAYRRFAFSGKVEQMVAGCVPPRRWELNHTSSWLNFHLKQDHQSMSSYLMKFCEPAKCNLGKGVNPKHEPPEAPTQSNK